MKIHIIVNNNGEEEVGLSINNSLITLRLPIGYDCIYENQILDFDDIDEEFKKEIIRFLKMLFKRNNIGFLNNSNNDNYDFISALLVVNDYNSYGLYRQSEKKKTFNHKGRINWSKTIHERQPIVNKKVVYSNLVYEYIDYESYKEIIEIQELCLSIISKTIGFILGFVYPKKQCRYQKKEIISILNEELKRTNEDTKIEMINHLLDFIKNTNFNTLDNGNIIIQNHRFYNIFEKLVDCYGVSNKKVFFPRAQYRFWNNDKVYFEPNPSIIDTIILDNKELPEYKDIVYVMDAKYRSGYFNEYDIFKQIRYKKYCESILDKKYKDIKNIFVLPKNLIKEKKIVEIEKFYATSVDCLDEKIIIAYVDTKSLLFETKKTIKCLLEEINNKDLTSMI